jgi:type II secretory pathway component PulK
MTKRPTQRGIALIQVLFLSLILSVLLLSIANSSKHHVALAQEALDRSEALLALQSQEATLLFTLLTNDRAALKDSPAELVRQWNFYNIPFPLLAGTAQIQDMAGLISLSHTELISSFLETKLQDPELARSLSAKIKDWQDSDNIRSLNGAEQSDYPAHLAVRNSPVQTEAEIRFIAGMTPDIYQLLRPYITTYPVRYTNPMTMPPDLLAIYSKKAQLPDLTQLKANGDLTADIFSQQTGLQSSEEIVFYPSNGLRLTFTAQVNNVRLQRQMTVTVEAYAQKPIQIWEYNRLIHEQL